VVLDLAATLSIALVAVTLGVRLVAGGLELRPALTVLLLVPELFAPVRAVASLFHASADGLAATERILDALGPAVDNQAPPDTRSARLPLRGASQREVGFPPARPAEVGFQPVRPAEVGRVGLREVTVRYPGRPLPALDRVDLELQPGELVAVVGASGAGKTTLGRVLVGLTRPDEGLVLAGGRALAGADPDWWRGRVAWASQHPVLVPGTVAANLALGRPEADPAAIEEAARLAGADRFVRDLPAGYDTVVGAGGHGLSAGQRQRLGLARALLRDAPLLVLDEPTVHLDPAAADRVATTVEALRGNRTVLLITHDPDLAARADRVVRLAAGRVERAPVPAVVR
jgi:ABC-type transport system involved in cytochrome bd biosynthesis fused ATPase/permease subunit